MKLEYIALNDNKITNIENLKQIKLLVSLNLANNLIDKFNIKEIP